MEELILVVGLSIHYKGENGSAAFIHYVGSAKACVYHCSWGLATAGLPDWVFSCRSLPPDTSVHRLLLQVQCSHLPFPSVPCAWEALRLAYSPYQRLSLKVHSFCGSFQVTCALLRCFRICFIVPPQKCKPHQGESLSLPTPSGTTPGFPMEWALGILVEWMNLYPPIM